MPLSKPAYIHFIPIFFVLLLMSGCAKQAKDESRAANERPQRLECPQPLVEEHPAREIVNLFMQALLRGENETVRNLLTPLARQKGREQRIPFTTPPSGTASFQLHGLTLHGSIGAYVQTTLTDLDEQGRTESAEIVWIVAKTNEGWRVAGAAVSLFDGQDKTIINFEDPEASQHAIAQAEVQATVQADRTERKSNPTILSQPGPMPSRRDVTSSTYIRQVSGEF